MAYKNPVHMHSTGRGNGCAKNHAFSCAQDQKRLHANISVHESVCLCMCG